MHPINLPGHERGTRRSTLRRRRFATMGLLPLTAAALLFATPPVAHAGVVADIDIGRGATDLEISPDGRHAYVASTNIVVSGQEINGTVAVIDTATNKVDTTIAVERAPRSLAVTPDNARVYVANQDSGSVSVIDTNTNAITTTIAVGSSPLGVAVTPDGSRVYVAREARNHEPDGNAVSVIDTATNTVTDIILFAGGAQSVAIAPDGSRAYVAGLYEYREDSDQGELAVIDTATNTVTDTIALDMYPNQIEITHDGSHAYITSYGGDGKVMVLDTTTNAVTATIPVEIYPSYIAFTPDGRYAYITNTYSRSGGPLVSIIDTSTHTVVSGLRVDGFPGGIDFTPDGAHTYVAIPVTVWGGKVSVFAPDRAPELSGIPPNGTVDQPYHHTFTVAGEPTPTVSVTSGVLPDGVTLSSDGVLSGKPTASGRFEFTVSAINDIAITDLPVTVTITDTTSPLGSLGSFGS
ncbi:beta-propeller fold lactonase family protein [Prescottella equi]